ncbi:MAG TPA: nucleotidyltransferase domain-containing protein [Bryobacteraceae bacterium]|nr:nucleotidyltransferase domain-containing protein [Bryobacteraceae bacterium]
MQSGTVDQKLTQLVERLKTTFGAQLISVILYGSAATDDWNQDRSDVNILCVLNRLTPAELRRAEPVLRWWREARNPPPLLLTEEEVQTSTDCFPMEFRDMQQYRRVLHGADVIRDLAVDNKFYRAQVEHELRAKQLRLRQHAAEVLSDPARLSRLLSDSISTFCVLGRHALILHGQPAHWKKREIVAGLRQTTGHSFDAFNEILSLRTANKPAAGPESVLLLERYLEDVAALVRFVDGLAS